tara:strand:- start:322 stop:507 length:186 start_codon:yes stop_codon:yes gene_type:complete
MPADKRRAISETFPPVPSGIEPGMGAYIEALHRRLASVERELDRRWAEVDDEHIRLILMMA